jgi:hypothetical protein
MLGKIAAALLVILVASFFLRNNIRYITDIAPEVLEQPVQQTSYSSEKIEFEKDSYKYTLSPVAKYTISGLVVSKKNYRVFSIYKTDSVFPYDLCLIWGSNVQSGVFRNRAVRFAQDCRWCTVEWSGNVIFNQQELSNNHLLTNDRDVADTVKSLVAGDQVTIRGKLVNVKAVLVGKAGEYDAKSVEWLTSKNRIDKGAGACEIIYVEDIQVLRKSNLIAHIVFQSSLYGLLAVALWSVFKFLH